LLVLALLILLRRCLLVWLSLLILLRRCLLVWLSLLILLRRCLLVWLSLLILLRLRLLVRLALLVLLRGRALVLWSLRRGRRCSRRGAGLVGRILLVLLREGGHAAQHYSQRQDAHRPAIPWIARAADCL
jgi:hypothetical protein